MATTKKMGRDSCKSATLTTRANSITLLGTATEPRVDSRLLAQHLGVKHKNTLGLIEKYKSGFLQVGIVPFKTEKILSGRGRPERYALLNEDQSYYLLALSRTSKRTADLKLRLVLAFREVRQRLDIRSAEYLPTYHALHDEIQALAEHSANSRFVHMNLNKLVNKAAGIESGQRPQATLPRLALLTVAQHFAAEAMHGATDHREGYARAKIVLEHLKAPLVEVSHA